MTQIFNRKDKTKLRQQLRKELPICERKVWYFVRNRQVAGVKFRRQVSISNIVVDFFAPEIKLALEIDGDSHYKDDVQRLKDKKRDEFLKSLGLLPIRFTNLDILKGFEYSMSKLTELVIYLKEEKNNSKQPPPAPPS